MERVLRKTRVVTLQGAFFSQETPEALIGESGSFVRCHQSFWVNLKHVRTMGNNKFTMDNGTSVPISRTYLQEAKQRFLHVLIRN